MKESCMILTEEDSIMSPRSSWWNRRSSLEKQLFVTTVLFFLIASGMSGWLMWAYMTPHPCNKFTVTASRLQPSGLDSDEATTANSIPTEFIIDKTDQTLHPICVSPSCISAANDVLMNGDFMKNPCDDFYEFACAGFRERAIIHDDKSSVSPFSGLGTEMMYRLKDIIEEPIVDNETRTMRMAKDFYSSCMNKSRIEELGIEPLEARVAQLGGWPALMGSTWNSTGVSWQSLTILSKNAGLYYDHFINVQIIPDMHNESQHILAVDQPYLGFPRHQLIKGKNDSMNQEILKYTVELAVLMGADRDQAMLEMEQVLDFQIDMAQVLTPNDERRNITELYNEMTLADLQKISPDVNWEQFIESLIPYDLDQTEPVIVVAINYTKIFNDLLKGYDIRVLANYLVSIEIQAMARLVSEKFRGLEFQMEKRTSGIERERPYWQQCLDHTISQFGIPIATKFVRKYIPKDTKVRAQEMVNFIQAQTEEIINEIEWANEKTIKQAKKKLKLMQKHVAYPDEVLDDDKVDKLYENLTGINDIDFFENVITLEIFNEEQYEDMFRKPVEKNHWKYRADSCMSVNAHYSAFDNSINLPAGILNGIFYGHDRPNYMNFGAIGVVVGHELTHGFDDVGRQFDEHGYIKNWWDAETDENFKNRSQCLVDQYHSITNIDTGEQLNGIKTLGENIADNGGLKQAYLAYQKWVTKNGRELPLPGLNFTPNQLFWIGYSNVWCEKKRVERSKFQANFDSHSPARYRVNVPLSNSPHFSKDFNCPLGSPMNPESKCSVW